MNAIPCNTLEVVCVSSDSIVGNIFNRLFNKIPVKRLVQTRPGQRCVGNLMERCDMKHFHSILGDALSSVNSFH